MTNVRTFSAGGFRCHLLDAGRQWLDGGAMFGIVPKPLWERRIAADDQNRIPLGLTCLLVEHDDGPVLIDTGIGNKEDAKFRTIYGVENAGTGGRTRLEDQLQVAGFAPDDVRWVINTHLHFDHAGGNTCVEADGHHPRAAFPNATYVVQRGELDFASHTNERTRGSYLPPNFLPLSDEGRWQCIEGEVEILPGIRAIPTPGHVPFHQSILIGGGGEDRPLCFVADLIPTTAHVPLPWIMGYDLEPMVTLEEKRRLLPMAQQEQWLMVFEHDPQEPLASIAHDGKGFVAEPVREA